MDEELVKLGHIKDLGLVSLITLLAFSGDLKIALSLASSGSSVVRLLARRASSLKA